jgi:sporulation protein YlmC with PRC-barrel domain
MHKEKLTMIRNLLATTAIAALAATAVYAQQEPAQPTTPGQETMQPSPPADQQAAPVVKADGYLASNIMGESVYNGTDDNAENVGDVNDIVLDKDGKAQSLIVGVGGFLGVGERNVAIEFSKISWAERNGDRWVVYPATRDQLAALPEFDRRPYDPAPAPGATSAVPETPPATTTPAPAQ